MRAPAATSCQRWAGTVGGSRPEGRACGSAAAPSTAGAGPGGSGPAGAVRRRRRRGMESPQLTAAAPAEGEGEAVAQARRDHGRARRLPQAAKGWGAPCEVLKYLWDRTQATKELLGGLKPRAERLECLRESVATRECQLRDFADNLSARTERALDALAAARPETQAIEGAQAAAAAAQAANVAAQRPVLQPAEAGQTGLAQVLTTQAHAPQAAARLLSELDAARARLAAMAAGDRLEPTALTPERPLEPLEAPSPGRSRQSRRSRGLARGAQAATGATAGRGRPGASKRGCSGGGRRVARLAPRGRLSPSSLGRARAPNPSLSRKPKAESEAQDWRRPGPPPLGTVVSIGTVARNFAMLCMDASNRLRSNLHWDSPQGSGTVPCTSHRTGRSPTVGLLGRT